MRHFGHGIGHLQYERQHEINPDLTNRDTGMGQSHRTLEDISVSSDASDHDTGGSDKDHCSDGDAIDLDEEEDEDDGEIIEHGEGDSDASGIIDSNLDLDAGGSNSDGYASY